MELDCGAQADTEAFMAEVAAFDGFGRRTEHAVIDGIPHWQGEFWTPRQKQGHPLHEFSYRACFKPQLPAFFIERLTRPGEGVADPFMGRGTTPLEAALLGRRPIAGDVNPLSRMLVAPRLDPPSLAEVRHRLAAERWTDVPTGGDPEGLREFFAPGTLAKLRHLRARYAAAEATGTLDRTDAWIRMVALSRLTGHSPGFLSVRTMPPGNAVSARAQRRLNALHGLVPPERDVAASILAKSKSLLRGGTPAAGAVPILVTSPAQEMLGVPDASAALAVTSPPFLDIVDYAADNWLRSWFAGIDQASVAISMHSDGEKWQDMAAGSLSALARVVRPGGHVAYEVGDMPGRGRPLEMRVWDAAWRLPFRRVGIIVNRQDFTKTSNAWGVTNGKRGTNTNRIVLLRRL